MSIMKAKLKHGTIGRYTSPARYLAVALTTILVVSGLAAPSPAQQTVDLPITIDYPLLRSLLVQRGFPEKNESVTLLNEAGGCIYLALSRPQLSTADDLVRLELAVSAHGGTPLGGRCFTPLSWQGHLVLYEQPSVSPADWQLSFTTVDSQLLGADRRPAQITDMLWNLIKPSIWQHISTIKIDLAPPVADLKNFLLPLFPEKRRAQTRKMLSSMRPAAITVGEEALHLSIAAEVDTVYTPEDQKSDLAVSRKKLRKTVAAWERWDGLLVHLLSTLSSQVLSNEEKRTLTNILLDTRYRFVNELQDNALSSDIVREQFVSAWEELGPIFRKRLLRRDDIANALGYLAFLSSADALVALDNLGPTLGMEISSDGLIRLARMLRMDPSFFKYRFEINPDLRSLFELGPHDEGVPLRQDDSGDSSLWQKLSTPFGPAEAFAAPSVPGFNEIRKWRVPADDLDDYLKRVEQVLESAAAAVIAAGKVPDRQHSVFRDLIPAVAWQESCFRQFVVKGDKLTYLLSYNNTSVGLMQVNERIWRGLYNRELLRWDIRYNAAAGSEIAALYLTKYALRDKNGAAKMDDATLARLVYALYNGGPSQYSKFFKRLQAGTFYDSDNLFYEKYRWVTDGKINKVSICLIGR